MPDHSQLSTPLDAPALGSIETSSDLHPRPKDRLQITNWITADRLTAGCREIGEANLGPSGAMIRRLIGKLRLCSATAWLCHEIESGRAKVCPSRCKSRLCAICQPMTSWRIVSALRTRTDQMKDKRFVTLTLRKTAENLQERTHRLRTSFAKLRARKMWTRDVLGGVWVIEPKYQDGSDHWHTHVHAIVEGDYLSYEKLRATWTRITGDSTIVDVRRCYSSTQAAAYLTAYMGKKHSTDRMPAHRLVEYAATLHGQRLAGSFGIHHGLNVKSDGAPPRKKLGRIVSMVDLRQSARRGDTEAEGIYRDAMNLHRGAETIDAVTLSARASVWAEGQQFHQDRYRK